MATNSFHNVVDHVVRHFSVECQSMESLIGLERFVADHVKDPNQMHPFGTGNNRKVKEELGNIFDNDRINWNS